MIWLLAGIIAIVEMGLALRARQHADPETPMDNERNIRKHRFTRLWRHRDQRAEQTPTQPVAVRSLAEHDAAGDLADEYGDYFHAPELKAPLRSFLSQLSSPSLPGLEGVALAAWETSPDPSYLALYALIDETAQPRPLTQGTITAVLRAHDELTEQLRSVCSPLSCGLWFFDTRGQDLDVLRATLQTRLASTDDPLTSLRTGAEHISRLDIARAA